MPYRHEIYETRSSLFISHNHEEIRPSGLIALRKLGNTTIAIDPSHTPEGIIIPSAEEMAMFTHNLLPQHSEVFDDLESYVEKGGERIVKLALGLGRVTQLSWSIHAQDESSAPITDHEQSALTMLRLGMERAFGAQNSRSQRPYSHDPDVGGYL